MFAQLFGLSREELVGFLPAFRGALKSVSGIPGSTLGYYRDGHLVGVICYFPDLRVTFYRALALRPIKATVAYLRQAWLRWRWRPRLPTQAQARHRAYLHLARRQSPKEPTLHVLALGVAESARRAGIARRLLAAIAEDKRWPNIGRIQVETWHAGNASIYERLGFETIRRGSRKGVECWTMARQRCDATR
jgi:GNAT superfamily N-acetyltransferase